MFQPQTFAEPSMLPEACADDTHQPPSSLEDGLYSLRRVSDSTQRVRTSEPAVSEANDPSPRLSLIVVIPERHHVALADVFRRLPAGDSSQADVIIACAGRPTNLHALQRAVSSAQFLFAPVGTSAEVLRELAMERATGDIVTLLSGLPRSDTVALEQGCTA